MLPKIPATATVSDPSATGAARPAVRPRRSSRRTPPSAVSSTSGSITRCCPATRSPPRRGWTRSGGGSSARAPAPSRWVDDASASLEPLAGGPRLGPDPVHLPGAAGHPARARPVPARRRRDGRRDASPRRAPACARGLAERRLRTVFLGATVLDGGARAPVLGAVDGHRSSAFALFGTGPGGRRARGRDPAPAALIAVVLATILATLAAIVPLRAQLARRGRRRSTGAPAGRRAALAAPVPRRARPRSPAPSSTSLVGGSGIHPVLNAEGNPTVTLALTSFVAPLLLWVGGTLLLLRVVGAGLRHERTPRPRSCDVCSAPAASLPVARSTARAAAASRAIVVLALAVGFATSVLIFDATYRQQQVVDAQLTLGADLKATPIAADARVGGRRACHGPGDRRRDPVRRPRRLRRPGGAGPAGDRRSHPAAPSRRSPTRSSPGRPPPARWTPCRRGPTRSSYRRRPRRTTASCPATTSGSACPDANGQPADGRLHDGRHRPGVPDRAEGRVPRREPVIRRRADRQRPDLVRPRPGGRRRRRGIGEARPTAWVPAGRSPTSATTTARLANSITSVDLSSLVLLDIAFAVLIAAVGVALFLLAGLAERRRELATLIAIGAEPRQVRASMAGETPVRRCRGPRDRARDRRPRRRRAAADPRRRVRPAGGRVRRSRSGRLRRWLRRSSLPSPPRWPSPIVACPG